MAYLLDTSILGRLANASDVHPEPPVNSNSSSALSMSASSSRVQGRMNERPKPLTGREV